MAFPARPSTHVIVRRDDRDPGPWWWMCIQDTCIHHANFPLVGSQYPTHGDAIAGATEHLTRAAAAATTTKIRRP